MLRLKSRKQRRMLALRSLESPFRFTASGINEKKEALSSRVDFSFCLLSPLAKEKRRWKRGLIAVSIDSIFLRCTESKGLLRYVSGVLVNKLGSRMGSNLGVTK